MLLAFFANYYLPIKSFSFADEPSYQELLAAVHILEFIMLAIIYQVIGIPDYHIESCRKRVQFQRYDEFVEILMSYSARSNGKAPDTSGEQIK